MLKSHSKVDLRAICGRNRSRANEMAVKYSIPQTFTDYQEMIDQADLDAVVVAVPDDLHYPVNMGWKVSELRNGEEECQEMPVPEEFLQGSTRSEPAWDQVINTFKKQSIGTRMFIDSILEPRPIIPSGLSNMIPTFEPGAKNY